MKYYTIARNMGDLFCLFSHFGEYIRMVIDILRTSLTSPPAWRLIRDQLYFIGVKSLPVVAITGISTGMVLAAQSFFQLQDKGMAGMTGLMVTKSMLVELGPTLTAFMITGRVGAAICAELGTMQVTEQIDALRSMAVPPIQYLVAPRFIAMTIMVPVLTVFSCAMGIIGGYCIAVQVYGMSPHSFLDPIPTHVSGFDLSLGFMKSLIFGILIVTISCFRGMRTRGGAAGVGHSTTTSVVVCYSAILIANFLLTIAMNSMYWILLQPVCT